MLAYNDCVDIDLMRSMPEYVRERRLDGGVSSFNFSNKAFWDGHWNDITQKARGLFVDSETGKIVARSYDKFFAIDERPETTMDALKDTIEFPVRAYRKENGFLGIVSVHDGEFFIASKSTNEGEYAGYFRDIFFDQFDHDTLDVIKTFCEMCDVSFVFEVIDPIHDPHIVRYDKPCCVVLDIIFNLDKFIPIGEFMMFDFCENHGIPHKKKVADIHDFDELVKFCDDNFDCVGFEGYVFVDQSDFMFKYKGFWYKRLKSIRGLLQRIMSGKDVNVKKAYNRGLDDDDIAFARKFVSYARKHAFRVDMINYNLAETSRYLYGEVMKM